MPDFNAASGELGQVLLNPPTVAGWAQGRAWITPGTLLARGNFAREVVLPDMIDFVDPNLVPDPQTRAGEHADPERHGHHRRDQRAASPAAKAEADMGKTWPARPRWPTC